MGTPGLQNLVEGLRTNAIETFHRAQKLCARHEYPFGRFFQQLPGKLAADRIEKIVGRQDDRIFFRLNRQNVMLKHETARQVRQSGAIDVFRINRDDRHPEEIPDCAEEALFVHLARIEHLTYP